MRTLHRITQLIDLASFQLRRNAVPIAVNVGGEKLAAKADVRQLFKADVAGYGFNITLKGIHGGKDSTFLF